MKDALEQYTSDEEPSASDRPPLTSPPPPALGMCAMKAEEVGLGGGRAKRRALLRSAAQSPPHENQKICIFEGRGGVHG